MIVNARCTLPGPQRKKPFAWTGDFLNATMFSMFPFLSIELVLLIASALLFISVVASKVSDRLGIPALMLFLIIGMLAGLKPNSVISAR